MGMEDRVYGEIALLVLFLVSAAANSLALLVFCRRPGLRTISNRFVMNLLATNLVMSVAVAGVAAGERNGVLSGAWGVAAAAVGEASVAGGALAALLAVLLIALDQHHAVTDPLRCHARLLQRRPAALCAAAWAAGAGAAVLRAAAVATRRALPRAPAAQAAELAGGVLYLVLGVLAPAAGVCVMYARIYRAARSSGLRARAHAASALQLHEPPPLPLLPEDPDHLTLKIDVPTDGDDAPAGPDRKFGPFLLPPDRPLRCPSVASLRATRKEGRSSEDLRRGLPAVSSAPSLAAPLLAGQPKTPQPSTNGSRITSIRCRISNASMFRYREESRALRVGLVTGALVALHVPHALLAAMEAAAPGAVGGAARATSLGLLLAAAAAAPFLFALRSRRVQREARRLLLPEKSAWTRSGAAAAAADGQRARAALALLKTLSPGEGDSVEADGDAAPGNAGPAGAGRGSFSSGGSTQLSSASDE